MAETNSQAPLRQSYPIWLYICLADVNQIGFIHGDGYRIAYNGWLHTCLYDHFPIYSQGDGYLTFDLTQSKVSSP